MKGSSKLYDKRHAKLVEDIVKYIKEIDKSDDIVWLKTEEHYNHYGNRGSVDIAYLSNLSYSKGKFLRLYEVKPEIRNLNETIRQCKKAYKFFLSEFSGKRLVDLFIEPTSYNLDVLLEHQETLNSAFSGGDYRIAFFYDGPRQVSGVSYSYPQNDPGERYWWLKDCVLGGQETLE